MKLRWISLDLGGLGVAQFASIWLIYFAQGLQTSLPYTIAVYMIRYWAAGKGMADEQRVGQLTGLLTCFYQLAQFFTSYPWGMISDRWGRKPVILIGNLTSFASVVAFGFSNSFMQASAARFAGGFFNGITGALKTVLGESCDAIAQAQAMSYLNLAWGLGTILGPVIGGYFAYPCDGLLNPHGPLCTNDSWLQTRPFSIPCLIVAAVTLAASMGTDLPSGPILNAWSEGFAHGSIMGIFCMVETLPSKADPEAAAVHRYNILPAQPAPESAVNTDDHPARLLMPQSGSAQLFRQSHDLGLERRGSMGEGWPTGRGGSGSMERKASFGGTSPRPTFSPQLSQQLQQQQLRDFESSQLVDTNGTAPPLEAGSNPMPWWKQLDMHLLISTYGLIALMYTLVDEVTPIFASAPVDVGGLDWSASKLAGPFSFRGVILIIYALFIYTYAQRRMGIVASAQLGLWLTYVHTLMVPLASLWTYIPHLPEVIMYSAMAVKAVAATHAYTAIMVATNEIAPDGQLGSVNGVSQTLAALTRAIAPALGGVLWALSFDLKIPLHQFLAFFVNCIFIAAAQVLMLFFKDEANVVGKETAMV